MKKIFAIVAALMTVTSYVLLWPISSQLDAYASPQAQVNPCSHPEFAAANPSICGGEDQGPQDEGPCADPEYAVANPSKCGEDQGPQDEGPCGGDPEYAPAYCRPPDCSIPEFASSDCGESALPESSGPSTPPDCSIPEFASSDCGESALPESSGPKFFVPPTEPASGDELQDSTGSEEVETDSGIDEGQDSTGSGNN